MKSVLPDPRGRDKTSSFLRCCRSSTFALFSLLFGTTSIFLYLFWIHSRSSYGYFEYLIPMETTIRVHYFNRPIWLPMDIFAGCDRKCYLTDGEGNSYAGSDVVVFHAPYVKVKHPPKKMGQIWVFHALEPPGAHWNKLDKWKNVFNWTMSYRRDADITNTYGVFRKRTDNQNILEKERKDTYANWQKKSKGIAWMVSNCETSGKRDTFVKKLKKVTSVDIYGKCGVKNCSRKNTVECLKPYKFYLSFESELCKDYITEKSFKMYASSEMALPIVRSDANLSMFLPPGSYIDTSKFKHISDLGKYVKAFSKNKTRIKKYMKWRAHYKINHGTIHSAPFCELCRRLHQKDVHKYERLYRDIGEWLLGGKSKRKSCRLANDLH
ncbi:alpha-(1,3)-fucosyltransferase C-like [Mizuhopecten yessoensis]|uniref:Fucosyltransferase n=1 Tax=Mizuhopecten yessoensis TaxID=6573 RepID=A0A210QA83_MIZYE|nr:alpha-(1,3)-fucosyltransferase C-like [Mizuhopecten yessoensis]OWF45648.1 Alpha-(1,3)-fucosyltransferase C [Mizuhopecten yessoensis]